MSMFSQRLSIAPEPSSARPRLVTLLPRRHRRSGQAFRAGAFGILVLALGACATLVGNADPELVVLEARPGDVTAGDEITLVLENRGAQHVGYNLCTSTMQRFADGAWDLVPSDRVCTLELRILGPDDVADFPVKLDASTNEGTYRFVTRVEFLDTGEREIVRSKPFEVSAYSSLQ